MVQKYDSTDFDKSAQKEQKHDTKLNYKSEDSDHEFIVEYSRKRNNSSKSQHRHFKNSSASRTKHNIGCEQNESHLQDHNCIKKVLHKSPSSISIDYNYDESSRDRKLTYSRQICPAENMLDRMEYKRFSTKNISQHTSHHADRNSTNRISTVYTSIKSGDEIEYIEKDDAKAKRLNETDMQGTFSCNSSISNLSYDLSENVNDEIIHENLMTGGNSFTLTRRYKNSDPYLSHNRFNNNNQFSSSDVEYMQSLLEDSPDHRKASNNSDVSNNSNITHVSNITDSSCNTNYSNETDITYITDESNTVKDENVSKLINDIDNNRRKSSPGDPLSLIESYPPKERIKLKTDLENESGSEGSNSKGPSPLLVQNSSTATYVAVADKEKSKDNIFTRQNSLMALTVKDSQSKQEADESNGETLCFTVSNTSTTEFQNCHSVTDTVEVSGRDSVNRNILNVSETTQKSRPNTTSYKKSSITGLMDSTSIMDKVIQRQNSIVASIRESTNKELGNQIPRDFSSKDILSNTILPTPDSKDQRTHVSGSKNSGHRQSASLSKLDSIDKYVIKTKKRSAITP